MKALYLHCASSRQFYFFEQEILNRENDYLAILPVNRAVRLQKQRILNRSQQAGLKDPPIFTFDQLLLNIYAKLPHARRVLSADMLHVLIEAVLEKKGPKLPYLLRNTQLNSGLVNKISESLSELRRFGFDALSFEQITLEEKQDLPQKFSDFSALLLALDQELADRFIDEPFAKHTAAKLLNLDLLQQCYPDVKEIFIAGYGLFTPAMYAFIEKLRHWLPVHLKLVYNPQNPTLFVHTQAAYQKFMNWGAQEINSINESYLAGNLFNREIEPLTKPDPQKRIQVAGYQDRKTEIEYIAREIYRLHAEDKIPLSKIALTCANLNSYIPLIQKSFSSFGIPFNLSTGFALKQSPLFRRLIHPLQIILSEFAWTEVLQFLNSKLLVTEDQNLKLLHKALVSSRIKNLHPGWPKKILLSLFKDEERVQLSAMIEWLEHLMQPLYSFPTENTLTGYRSDYIALLKEMHFLDWYRIPAPDLSERDWENEFRAFNRFMKLSDQMVWIASYITDDRPISLKRFTEYLQSVTSKADYNLTEWPDYGVQIMPRLEIQAIDTQVLFLAGLTDGDFPRSSTKDVFFNDALREKMGLVATEDLLAQDRFIFYELMDGPAREIFVTYPKYDEERILVPSTFIRDLQDVFKVELSDLGSGVSKNQNLSQAWESFGLSLQKRQFDQTSKLSALLKQHLPEASTQIKDLLRKNIIHTQRMYPLPFADFEGVLPDNKDIQSVLKQNHPQQVWSVSRLETYAFCPMRYAFQSILKIEEWDHFEQEATSLERGALVHKVLDEFYRELVKLGRQAQPLAQRNLLLKIAKKHFEIMPFSGFFWELERRAWLGDENNKGLFDIFLEIEQQEIDQSGFIPTFFEYDFGGEVQFSRNEKVFKLRGRIDRVDLNAQGDAMVIDYKTGSSAASQNAKRILAGLSFQLPLYLLALNHAHPELQPAMAIYYVIKDEDNCARKPYLVDTSLPEIASGRGVAFIPNSNLKNEHGQRMHMEEVLDFAVDQAIAHNESFKRGIFRHTRFPNDKACTSYCAYRRICQKHPAKINRLEQLQQEDK